MTLYDRARRAYKRAHGYRAEVGTGYGYETLAWLKGWMAGYESAKRAARRRKKP